MMTLVTYAINILISLLLYFNTYLISASKMGCSSLGMALIALEVVDIFPDNCLVASIPDEGGVKG